MSSKPGSIHLCNPKSIANDPQNKVTFRCLQSKNDADIEIALIGDSHAEHLFLGLAEQLPHKNVMIHARGSYPSIDSPSFKDIYRYILDTPSVHTVIISAHWVSRIDHIPKNTTLEEELSKTVQALISKGKKVYLFGDVPRFPFVPERCKFMAQGLGRSICSVPKGYVQKYERTYGSALRNVTTRFEGLQYLELRDQFCDDSRCNMIKDQILMYRDNHHLNIPGSHLMGKIIVEKYPELQN